MIRQTVTTLIAAGVIAAGPANAATIGALEGAYAPSGWVEAQFNGTLCDAPDVCTWIPYNNTPGGVPGGVAALDAWLAQPGHDTAIGHSEGAEVAYAWAYAHPAAGKTFTVTGNPERKYGGLTPGFSAPTPENTTNHITDIALQYEFFADQPNNPASPYYGLAQFNTFLGYGSHSFGYQAANLADPANVRWSNGGIDYVLIPQRAPLSFGIPAVNDWLQPLIETAYTRPSGPVIYGRTPTPPAAAATAAPASPTTAAPTTAAPAKPTATAAVTAAPVHTTSTTPAPAPRRHTTDTTRTTAHQAKTSQPAAASAPAAATVSDATAPAKGATPKHAKKDGT